MNPQKFNQLRDLLALPKRIAIVPHKNPDGDAMGSVLAAYHFLKGKGHSVKVVSPNDYPDFLNWLPGSEKVLKFDLQNSQSKKALLNSEIVFLMDFNDLSRVGDDMKNTLKVLDCIFIMIDHHEEPSDEAQFIFSDTQISSTAQMFYHFLESLEETNSIDKNIATCIYTGILTDTGSFRFPKTTPTTLRIAANLIEKGADNARIYNDVFDQNSFGKLQLLGQALQNLKVISEYKTAYITLTKKEKDKFNFQKGDTEGIVNYALSIKNIVLGVIFIEDEEQEIVKISFRSKGTFSVNKFARLHFEGGGHDNAAGGRSQKNLNETINIFLSLLPHYSNELIHSYE